MLRPKKSNSSVQAFTDDEIRAKALEIWKSRHKQPGLPEDDWKQAIEELERERSIVKRINHITCQKSQELWNWTGFKEKKFWDILQLLFVPLVLTALGFGVQEWSKNSERQQQKADKDKEQELANDKAGQETLSNYLDQMAILLQQGLLDAIHDDGIFSIAQSKTITALQVLDPKRQQAVIQFLEAANLNSLDGNKGLLYEARVSKVDFRKSDLSGSTLKSADISLARLSGIDLSGSTLRGADLKGSDLTSARLGGIDLRDATLEGTGFVQSDLRIALFNNANLKDANFTGANLKGAFFTGANLKGAFFTEAILTKANLAKAKNLTDSQIGSAKLCGTILPDNSILNRDRDCEEIQKKEEESKKR